MQVLSCLLCTALQSVETLPISSETRLNKNYGSGCDLDQTPRSDGFLRMTVHMNVTFWCVSVFTLRLSIEYFLADMSDTSSISRKPSGCQGLWYFGCIYQASDDRRSVEDVRHDIRSIYIRAFLTFLAALEGSMISWCSRLGKRRYRHP
jgi:hypothetical protein